MKKLSFLLAFLLGLAGGLGGESLLLLRAQCRQIENSLRADFVVLLVPAQDVPAASQKQVEDKITALPDVESVRYVSKEEALDRLRRKDPQLVDSVAWLGENPLPSSFEVRLAPQGFGRISDWISSASSISDWSDVRYKSGEVKAILQAQFYGYWIDMIFGFSAAFVVLMAFCVLWISPHHLEKRLHTVAPAFLAAAGCVCGAALALTTASPLRLIASWWSWPSWISQMGLILILALAGWSLCAETS